MAMTLRLPDELNEKVRQQAEAEDLSMQAVVVKATREYLARHGLNAEIDEAMAEIKATFGEALRRLGE
jgi:predicted transcriptional regulator